jgi:hypothetical protein
MIFKSWVQPGYDLFEMGSLKYKMGSGNGELASGNWKINA